MLKCVLKRYRKRKIVSFYQRNTKILIETINSLLTGKNSENAKEIFSYPVTFWGDSETGNLNKSKVILCSLPSQCCFIQTGPLPDDPPLLCEYKEKVNRLLDPEELDINNILNAIQTVSTSSDINNIFSKANEMLRKHKHIKQLQKSSQIVFCLFKLLEGKFKFKNVFLNNDVFIIQFFFPGNVSEYYFDPYFLYAVRLNRNIQVTIFEDKITGNQRVLDFGIPLLVINDTTEKENTEDLLISSAKIIV